MRLVKWTAGLALAALRAVPAAAQQPVKIRVAWTAPVSNWASILLEKKDLAKHLGKSYTLEPVRYAGTPLMITALANGELEVANLAYSTIAIAIKNAGLEDLRVIADEFRDGVEGRYTNEFYVLKDGPIQKVSDLKGKVVATNAAGSAVDFEGVDSSDTDGFAGGLGAVSEWAVGSARGVSVPVGSAGGGVSGVTGVSLVGSSTTTGSVAGSGADVGSVDGSAAVCVLLPVFV